MDGLIDRVVEQLVTKSIAFLPKLGAGIVIFLAFWVLAWILARMFRLFEPSQDVGRRYIIHLLGNITRVVVMTIGGVTALGTMGVNVSAIVTGLGLTGFALGFAFRDALSNILAGILILIYRPYRIRDRIAVSGFEGTVVEIDLRYTTLQGEDRVFLIPNSILFTQAITKLGPS